MAYNPYLSTEQYQNQYDPSYVQRAIGSSAPMQQQPHGLYEVESDGLDEKGWKKTGVDISEWFNYGFTEDTWRDYCQKQVW